MPVITLEREGIMVDFDTLPDEQRIERFGQLAKVALDRFGMPTATLKHRSYMENVLYEVSDEASGAHASLRICRPGWEGDALEREVCWLSGLGRDTALRIPIPIPTLEGEPFAVVECEGIPDPRACVLFHWVDGVYAAPEELTPARLRSVGQFLAKLHDHAETFRLPAELAIDRFDADALDVSDHRANVSSYFEAVGDLEAFDEAVAAAVKLMRELGGDSTVAGIIHGDFHQRNYVFDGDHIGALDFETMHWGYYVYDLATTLSYLVPEFLRDVDPEPLRAAVIEGYSAERGLPEGYERMLRIFAAYRVWIMADWSSGSPRMLEHDWARRRLDAMPEQIRNLLA
jgi:Ser/Thr protein kinase RdoA (MazF antagonist)